MSYIEVNDYSPVDSPYLIYHNIDPSTDTKADSTSVKITIIDPAGTTQVDAASMDNDDTGEYSYTYHKGASATAMTRGEWTIRVDAIDGTGDSAKTSSTYGSFLVN